MKLLFLTLILSFAAAKLKAQPVNFSDTASIKNAVSFAKEYYFTSRGDEAAIYNGVLHSPYPANYIGIPYFYSDDWQTGTVVFQNLLYSKVLMKYDMVKDIVIVSPHANSGLSIELYSPRVARFNFLGFNFIYINQSQVESSLIPGLYQVLAEGKLIAIAKKAAVINETIKGNELERKFTDVIKYYIVKGNNHFFIKKKKSMFSIFAEHKKQVQQYLAANKYNFKKNKEATIVAAVIFYNQITD